MTSDKTIRVVIIDDSAFMRRAIARIITEGSGFEVVGMAASSREGIALVRQLRPDVVTLDIEMPEMNGVEVLQHLMTHLPLPVVMLSSLTRHGADITLRCLELGAVDFIAKPSGSVSEDLVNIRYLIWQKLRNAASIKVNGLAADARQSPQAAAPPSPTTTTVSPARAAKRLVAIGVSTGGPRALMELLAPLPATLPAALLIVQHMPAQFTGAMANRLNNLCALEVREAVEGEQLLEGSALIAPGGRHLLLDENARVMLTDAPPLWGVRPAVDYMMEDAARVFGPACLGIVMTGMGRDGTAGVTAIKLKSGTTIAQDEATSVVFGMPRSAIEAGVIDYVLPLPDIAPAIAQWCALFRPLTAKR